MRTSTFRLSMEQCECPVCLEVFEREGVGEPIVLTSCGHSVCRECCYQLQDFDSVVCPLCRSVSIGSAANFPKNYVLAAYCPYTCNPRRPVRPISKAPPCVKPIRCSHFSSVELDAVRERLHTVVILKMLVELRDIHYNNIVKYKKTLNPSKYRRQYFDKEKDIIRRHLWKIRWSEVSQSCMAEKSASL